MPVVLFGYFLYTDTTKGTVQGLKVVICANSVPYGDFYENSAFRPFWVQTAYPFHNAVNFNDDFHINLRSS